MEKKLILQRFADFPVCGGGGIFHTVRYSIQINAFKYVSVLNTSCLMFTLCVALDFLEIANRGQLHSQNARDVLWDIHRFFM